ncbi:MAG: hypothetical protein ACJ79R_17175 [Anaeromyxobacteraceae bacterium]
MARSEVEVVKHSPRPRVSRVMVGFSTPRQWNVLSALIRSATGSRTSHAWVQVHDPLFGRDLVLEAHATGLRLVPFTVFNLTNRVVAVAYPKCDLEGGLEAAGAWLGARFDFEGLVGLFVELVARHFGRHWKNVLHGSTALFCSEAVTRMLQAGGFPRAATLTPQDTTPEDLLEFLARDPSRCRIEYEKGVAKTPTRRRLGRLAKRARRERRRGA